MSVHLVGKLRHAGILIETDPLHDSNRRFIFQAIQTAAKEIDRLQSDLSIFRGVAHELDRIRGQLREAAETLERLYTENEQLTAERDEARRDWCNLEALEWDEPTKTAQSIAKHRGWDCFEEGGK